MRYNICTVIFLLGFLLASSCSAENTGVPELPALYYGKVISSTTLNGHIEAKIDNKTYGFHTFNKQHLWRPYLFRWKIASICTGKGRERG